MHHWIALRGFMSTPARIEVGESTRLPLLARRAVVSTESKWIWPVCAVATAINAAALPSTEVPCCLPCMEEASQWAVYGGANRQAFVVYKVHPGSCSRSVGSHAGGLCYAHRLEPMPQALY